MNRHTANSLQDSPYLMSDADEQQKRQETALAINTQLTWATHTWVTSWGLSPTRVLSSSIETPADILHSDRCYLQEEFQGKPTGVIGLRLLWLLLVRKKVVAAELELARSTRMHGRMHHTHSRTLLLLATRAGLDRSIDFWSWFSSRKFFFWVRLCLELWSDRPSTSGPQLCGSVRLPATCGVHHQKQTEEGTFGKVVELERPRLLHELGKDVGLKELHAEQGLADGRLRRACAEGRCARSGRLVVEHRRNTPLALNTFCRQDSKFKETGVLTPEEVGSLFSRSAVVSYLTFTSWRDNSLQQPISGVTYRKGNDCFGTQEIGYHVTNNERSTPLRCLLVLILRRAKINEGEPAMNNGHVLCGSDWHVECLVLFHQFVAAGDHLVHHCPTWSWWDPPPPPPSPGLLCFVEDYPDIHEKTSLGQLHHPPPPPLEKKKKLHKKLISDRFFLSVEFDGDGPRLKFKMKDSPTDGWK